MQQELRSDLNSIQRRLRIQFALGLITFLLLFSAGWVWRTVSMRGDLARVLSKTVERDLQFGDLRNSIINLDRAGGTLFNEIYFIENEKSVRFIVSGNPEKWSLYSIRLPVRSLKADKADSALVFRFNPFEGFSLFLMVTVPFLFGAGILAYRRSLKRMKSDIDLLMLEKTAEARLQVATQVAHDIRAPLAALNIVSKSLATVPDDSLRLMCSAVRRINDISNELLDGRRSFDKIRTQGERSEEPTLLRAAIESVLCEKRAQYSELKGIAITGSLEIGPDLNARVDSTEFSRAISNLIDNAVEACGAQGQISVEIRQDLGQLVVTVHDNGKGIPADILARIGERGFSFGKDGRPSGRGLGLAHARATCETVGGSMHVESTVGKGTSISLLIPIVPGLLRPHPNSMAQSDMNPLN